MTKRLSFEFDDLLVEMLDRLVEARGATSRAEVVRFAIKKLEDEEGIRAAGGRVAYHHADGTVEYVRVM